MIVLNELNEAWADWLEAIYDPDWFPYDRLEDQEI